LIFNNVRLVLNIFIKNIIYSLISSILSVSELTTGPDQIDHKNRIVTGQNNIPMKGARYLIQLVLKYIIN